jgi:hypothetical protein
MSLSLAGKGAGRLLTLALVGAAAHVQALAAVRVVTPSLLTPGRPGGGSGRAGRTPPAAPAGADDERRGAAARLLERTPFDSERGSHLPSPPTDGAFDGLLERFDEFVRSARFAPEFAGGEVVGLRVRGVRPGSPLARLGAEAGDVIETINGVGAGETDRLLEAYARARVVDSVAGDDEARRAPAGARAANRVSARAGAARGSRRRAGAQRAAGQTTSWW